MRRARRRLHRTRRTTSPGVLFSHIEYSYNSSRDICLCSFRATDSSGYVDEVIDTTANRRLLFHAMPPISATEMPEAQYEIERHSLMDAKYDVTASAHQ